MEVCDRPAFSKWRRSVMVDGQLFTRRKTQEMNQLCGITHPVGKCTVEFNVSCSLQNRRNRLEGRHHFNRASCPVWCVPLCSFPHTCDHSIASGRVRGLKGSTDR